MEHHLKTKKLNLSSLLKLFGILTIVAVTFSSCLKNHDDTPYPVQPVAGLNVANASPGTASFNFGLDNNYVNGPALVYGQRSGYLSAYTGKRLFSLTSGGTTQVIATDTLNLSDNNYYSLFITGLNSSPSFFFTQDDLSAPPTGKAKIRFIQLSPDGGPFDLGVKGGATLFSNQAYKTASNFITIDPATYSFQLKADNTGTITPIDSVAISAGKIYTVWSKGLIEGTGDYAISGKVNVNN